MTTIADEPQGAELGEDASKRTAAPPVRIGRTLRQAARLIDPSRRRLWIALLVFGIAVSAFEALAALVILAVLRLVTEADGPREVPILGNLEERFPGVNEATLLRWSAVVLGAFFLIRGGMLIAHRYFSTRVAQDEGAVLSERTFAAYLRMPYELHAMRSSAELIHNATNSVSRVVNLVFVPMVDMISQAFIAVALIAVVMLNMPMASLLAVGIVGPLGYGILRWFAPRVSALGRTDHDAHGHTLDLLQQSLQGVRDIKLQGREKHFVARFRETRRRQARASYLYATVLDTPRVLIEVALMILVLALMTVLGADPSSRGESLALLGLFAYVALRLIPAIHQTTQGVNHLRFGAVAVEALSTDLAAFEALAVDDDPAERPNPLALRQGVVFRGVGFRYPSADRPALEDVDLQVAAGESIGIVGPTGGGKSTLIDILTGLLTPTSGDVLVDGLPIDTVRKPWQAALGVVSQTIFLADATIRDNVAFGIDATEIDDGAVWRALSQAQLDAFVAELPDRLDAHVGEQGIRLSGGQRQRLAIARALYHDPAVLILDEGTASLDQRTEADVIEAVDALRGETTIVMVAHRLSTVRACDRIVVIADGRVADVGTYDGLLARNEKFQRMALEA